MNGGHIPAVRIEAQAKINIALRVFAPDATGYHPLETLFLRIDLADTVTVRPAQRERLLTSAATDIGPPEKNLAFRAAESYSSAVGWPEGWQIEITKRIPVGAGLGGGSADAGAVLRGLNVLCPTPLTPGKLGDLATTLGADVPFMTSDEPFAFGSGYGQTLTRLPVPSPRPLALALPDFPVVTSEAYRWLDLERTGQPARAPWKLDDLSWDALDGMIENDFENVVARRHPAIAQMKAALLEAGAVSAAMTGTGSVVFGLFEDPDQMESVVLPPGTRLVRSRTSGRVVQPSLMG